MKRGRYYASTLEPLATLAKGQCCSLKLEDDTHRLWLCRTDGGVTLETLRNGRWELTSGGCSSEYATVA